jgi:hypothetical protein
MGVRYLSASGTVRAPSRTTGVSTARRCARDRLDERGLRGDKWCSRRGACKRAPVGRRGAYSVILDRDEADSAEIALPVVRPVRVRSHRVDHGHSGGVPAAVDAVDAAWGRFDVPVNNAGLSVRRSVLTLARDRIELPVRCHADRCVFPSPALRSVAAPARCRRGLDRSGSSSSKSIGVRERPLTRLGGTGA